MAQTVAEFTTTDPSGIGTVDMTAEIEDYSDGLAKDDMDAEERYEQTPELHATPWRATLNSTDYRKEIGWYATQDAAAAAALAAAKSADGLIGAVEAIPYIEVR